MTHWEEMERPAEWLRRLDEQDGSYGRLVQESGNLALAAHRLARARCRVFGGRDGIPTLREVVAAARMIANHVPEHPDLPPPSVIGAEVHELCISDFPPRR
ncbi:MAG TPA: hypothetical protein VMI54_06150 [Polyangiaceae bacterium]|nr:hypothetical protein [Polyangiaceae bacterium]